MKEKTINWREFLHCFNSVIKGLKPSESVVVTKHGQSVGVFTKVPAVRKAPDYLANLRKLGQSVKEGQKFIDDLCALS